MAGRGKRLEVANEFLPAIASCGRRFFRLGVSVARLDLGVRGSVWFVDETSLKRIYINNERHPWRGFTSGGTLRALVIQLRNFVLWDKAMNPRFLGPWAENICGGDLWGYKGDIDQVREAAVRLGIIPPPPERIELVVPEAGFTHGEHAARQGRLKVVRRK